MARKSKKEKPEKEVLTKEQRAELKADRKKRNKNALSADYEAMAESMSERELRKEQKKREKKERKNDKRRFGKGLIYDKMKPREGYVFHSVYFIIDGGTYATIMTFKHNQGALDRFPAFWGINTIPRGLPEGVVVHRLDQVHPMPETWVNNMQNKAEQIADIGSEEQARGGSSKERGKARRRVEDLEIIGQEILAGASYLDVSFRLIVKAPSLDILDVAVETIQRSYKDLLGTVYPAAYYGNQRDELSTIFAPNSDKVGKHFMFTSTEFAGNYSLVTHGFEDVTGEYIGKMYGDVNSPAILFDCDNYENSVVIAGSNRARTLSYANFGAEKGVNLWGSKLSQAALMNNHRVIHFLFTPCDLKKLGPDLSPITSEINMDKGDVNMFEVFGSVEDELSLFAIQLEKVKLMAQELYPEKSNRGTLEGAMNEVLTDFYVDNNMWAYNAENHRDALRITGIPHEEVPRLREFSAYLAQRYKASVSSKNSDPKILDANRALNYLFQNMLVANGDIFDTFTTSVIDSAKDAFRVVYDFGALTQRGESLIMAQFINIFGFAIGSLSEGDVIFLHGCEMISDVVAKYIRMQQRALSSKGVRLVWIYDNVDAMLNQYELNHFDEADYTILGNMTANNATRYRDILGTQLPNNLVSQISNSDPVSYYIRRGFDNVVFNADIHLGI